jgi:hypothetical protein
MVGKGYHSSTIPTGHPLKKLSTSLPASIFKGQVPLSTKSPYINRFRDAWKSKARSKVVNKPGIPVGFVATEAMIKVSDNQPYIIVG